MKSRSIVIASCLTLMAGQALAQDTQFARDLAPADGEPTERETKFFVAVRPWVTNWEVPLIDARTVIPNPLAPVPVVQQSVIHAPASTSVIPLTVVGLRRNRLTLSVNLAPETRFSTGGLTASDVRRQETDWNIGYEIYPSLLLTIVYKTAVYDGFVTQAVQATTNNAGRAKYEAVLAGLSASAPLHNRLSIYGNFGAGIGKSHLDIPDAAGNKEVDVTYRLAEFGFSYRLSDGAPGEFLKSLTVQVGYRTQTVIGKSLALGTYSTTGALLSTQSSSIQSVAGGFLIGVVGVF
jgi:hypothetical protein